MAIDAGVPIVPIAIQGTFDVMPKGAKLVRRKAVRIVLQPPIQAGEYTRKQLGQMMDDVRDTIREALTAAQEANGRA